MQLVFQSASNFGARTRFIWLIRHYSIYSDVMVVGMRGFSAHICILLTCCFAHLRSDVRAGAGAYNNSADYSGVSIGSGKEQPGTDLPEYSVLFIQLGGGQYPSILRQTFEGSFLAVSKPICALI